MPRLRDEFVLRQARASKGFGEGDLGAAGFGGGAQGGFMTISPEVGVLNTANVEQLDCGLQYFRKVKYYKAILNYPLRCLFPFPRLRPAISSCFLNLRTCTPTSNAHRRVASIESPNANFAFFEAGTNG